MSSKYVKLNDGSLMPKIGLGTFAARGEQMKEVMEAALQVGYRAFDTAWIYKNEDAIGEVLDEWIKGGKVKREELFITSKLPINANRKEDIERYFHMSRRNLKLDYIDLYLIHKPFGLIDTDGDTFDYEDPSLTSRIDHKTDIISIYKGMEKLVDAGLVKSIGISNFNEEQIHRIMKHARIPPANLQVEAHVYMQQRSLMKVCKQYGIQMTAYGPLGAPYRGAETDEYPLLIKHPKVTAIAAKYNKSAAQILLKCLLQIDMTVIPKSATPSRIQQNFELLDFQINEKDLNELKKLDRGEDGRVLTFVDIFVGCEKHREYPFRRPNI